MSYVPDSRPVIVSAVVIDVSRKDFRGQNQEAPPYPSNWSFTVWHRLYTNLLASPMYSGLSSLSYSPPGVSSGSPKQSAPVPLVAKLEAPDAS